MVCTIVIPILGPWTQNDTNFEQNLSLVLYQRAPETKRREAILTLTSEDARFHKTSHIKSVHRIISGPDWVQTIDFFKFLTNPSLNPYYGVIFLAQKINDDYYHLWHDEMTTKKPLPQGSEIWIEMDNDPLKMQEPRLTPFNDASLVHRSNHWIYLTVQSLKNIIALDVHVQDFFANGLTNTCPCYQRSDQEITEILTRCMNDPHLLGSQCECNRCV